MFGKQKTRYVFVLFNTCRILVLAQDNITESQFEINSNATVLNKRIQTNKTNKNTSLTTLPDVDDDPLKKRMVTYCTTPDNIKGFCMPIKNCSYLMDLLSNPDAKEFLKKSKCGPKRYNTKNPKVCCDLTNHSKHENRGPFPKKCGYQNITIAMRVVGGKEAILGEFPWIARLMHKKKTSSSKVFGCSGFLIAPNFVLTAAHCLKSENTNILGPIFEVQLGEHDTKTKIDCTSKNKTCAPKPQRIRVKNSFVHPLYNMTSRHHHHDIGLIHLKKAANFTAYVYPICILEKVDFEPFEYWLSGWGTTETERLSRIKMKVSVPPFSHSNCTKLYENMHVKITDKQLCAGGKRGKDSCTGDSGGPLMIVKDKNHWFAAGVVSYGLACGRENWPGVYTNITSYVDWIKETMLKNVGPKTRQGKSKH